MDAPRFARNVLLWLVPVAAVWLIITPFYNRFLITVGENLVHLTENPDVTDLVRKDRHTVLTSRKDFPAVKSVVQSFRVTDLHFNLILLAVLFLAVPDMPWRKRTGNLGLALLVALFFHLLLVLLWVKFAYATQLGQWSLENYSPFKRETWGMAKHLFDLPFKLAIPLALWAAFYLPLLAVQGAGRDLREKNA